jgi:hypothetical protein
MCILLPYLCFESGRWWHFRIGAVSDRMVSSAAFYISIDLCSNSVGFWQEEKHSRSWQHFAMPQHRVDRWECVLSSERAVSVARCYGIF